jgi:hypothetical protein
MKWSRLLAVLALLAATPAAAQIYPEPYYGGVISPGEVIAAARSLGLQPVSEPRLRGPVWIVRAIARDGTMIRVAVDSRSGRVIEMYAINRPGMGPADPDSRFAMRGRGYDPYGAPPSYRDEPHRAVPQPYDDDDDDADSEPVPQPRSYAPAPRSSYGEPHSSKRSSKPARDRVASRPPAAAPLPKARPDNIEAGAGTGDKDKTKPAMASGPKEPAVTGSVAAEKKDQKTEPAKPDSGPAKQPHRYPVQPLE